MKLFHSRAFKLFICIIAALSIGAVIAAYTHSNSSPLSSTTSTLLHPLQRVSAYMSYKFGNFNDSFKSSKKLAEENKKLKDRIEQYQQDIVDYNEMKKKLETYEDFLEVKEENQDFKFQNSIIISRDSANPYQSFTLNKGSNHGIEVNDPVIYGKNLVGVVTSVSPTTCTVNSIANPKVNVGIYETYSNEIGYATGTGDSKNCVYCKIPGLKKDSSISPNGIICTSGSGGIFPKGLIVGTVYGIDDSKDGISTFALVRSEVDISELSEVFVIVDFDGQGVVTLSGE